MSYKYNSTFRLLLVLAKLRAMAIDICSITFLIGIRAAPAPIAGKAIEVNP